MEQGLDKTLEKTFAVGLETKSISIAQLKENLIELESLIEAAGGEVVGSTYQHVDEINPATALGKGKTQELAELFENNKPDLVVIGKELKGSQLRNLEEIWKCKVVDRTQLILDIFARRARSFEGKLQVELAQNYDQLAKVVGGWLGSLSRLGGGIGTRGPGESALETDRRILRRKITNLEAKLKKVKAHRKEIKKNRAELFNVAVVGYTNAGKTSLLEALTGAQPMAMDQVFATLDPLSRQLKTKDPKEPKVIITDTVGFIQNLPEKLIQAFESTLEESADANLILHVVDVSDPNFEFKQNVVDELIENFGWGQKQQFYIYNKFDLVQSRSVFPSGFPKYFTSTKSNYGIKKLIEDIKFEAEKTLITEEFYFTHEQHKQLYSFLRIIELVKREDHSQGVILKAKVSKNLVHEWAEYLVKD